MESPSTSTSQIRTSQTIHSSQEEGAQILSQIKAGKSDPLFTSDLSKWGLCWKA